MFQRRPNRKSDRGPEPDRHERAIRLLTLLVEEGSQRMLAGDVTLVDHSMQTAHLAWQAGSPISLVAAALLHDVGRLLHDMDGKWAGLDLDPRHEVLGADVLEPIFGQAVSEPVRLHVLAKRYLAAAEPGYIRALSSHARDCLARQGGPFHAEEARNFLARPFAAEAVQLRRWDDASWQAGTSWPEIQELRELLSRVVDEAVARDSQRPAVFDERKGRAS